MWLGKSSYVGLCPVECGRVNVCGLFKKTAIRDIGPDPAFSDAKLGKFIALLCQMMPPALAETMRTADWDSESLSSVAAFQLGAQSGASRSVHSAPFRAGECPPLFLGDAERMIPPFTGNGMSMAFEAADLAANILLSDQGGAHSEDDERWSAQCEQIAARLHTKFSRRMSLSLFLHPFLIHPAGQVMVRALVASGFFPFHRLAKALRS